MTHDSNPVLSAGQLDAYLARIGMTRPERADHAALAAIHKAHLMAFTWEALDAYMGWPNGAHPQDAFAKMVEGQRGGWCFEMNGLLGAALAALGFRVTRLCAGVNRAGLGDAAIGNHLTLRVDLDRPYLAEVGVADAIVEPVPLVPGVMIQRGFAFSIAPTPDGWLRFHNHPLGLAPSFDFRPDHVDEQALSKAHGWLMQDRGSPFTNNLVILRHTAEGYEAVQDNRYRRVTAAGAREHIIQDAEEFEAILRGALKLTIPQPHRVWARIAETTAQRQVASGRTRTRALARA